MWAISQCPLIYGNLLIVASQAPGAGVVAYDKNTGDVVWATPSLGPVGYSSPNLVKISGEDHIVMPTSSDGGKGHIVGINPKDGKILWDFDSWECRIPCGMVTPCGDNRMLMVGGYELGALMIQVTKNADGTFTPKELFRTTAFGDQTKPAVFHDGYFYGMYRTNAKRDGLMCMDTEGNIKWKTSRNPNFDRGSIIIVDGLMIASDGESKLYLIDPSGEEYKQISVAELLVNYVPSGSATPGPPQGRPGGAPGQGRPAGGPGQGRPDGAGPQGPQGRPGGAPGPQMGNNNNTAGQNWAPMALSDGKLIIRDQTQMICVKVSK